jgi:ParB family chromosome partitioning protein
MSDPARRKELSRRIRDEALSVRQAEALAAEMGGAPVKEADAGGSGRETGRSTQKGPELREMEERLIHELGTKVVIKGSEKKGRIEIEYYSMEDLERIYDVLSGKETAGRDK